MNNIFNPYNGYSNGFDASFFNNRPTNNNQPININPTNRPTDNNRPIDNNRPTDNTPQPPKKFRFKNLVSY